MSATAKSKEINMPDSYTNTISDAKIMVISDEVVNAEVIRDFLTEHGYPNIVITNEVEDAFEMAFEERPDAILYENIALTDAAISFLERIRKNPKTRLVPLLILTAEADEKSKLKALELGVVDVIIKPASANELALRLRNILSVKTYHDQVANFDNLTKLPNRETFINRVDHAIKYSNRYKTIGAVLQLGFNQFAYGISVGNQLLKTVAERINNVVRESDIVSRIDEQEVEVTISRLGENGFTILLPIISKPDDAALVSQRLYEQISAPYKIDDRELFLKCDIGISTFPEDGQDKDLILNAASIAANKAMSDSTVNFAFHSKELNARSTNRLKIENSLPKAILENQFKMHYQPKVCLKTNEVIGAEALIRWTHPELGAVNPQEFIEIAEQSDNIFALGRWVVRDVINQIKQWRAQGLNTPRVAFNLSSLQFKDERLLPEIEGALNAAGIDGSAITIEMTETAVKDNIEQVIVILRKLQALGVKISIDDFGTGYSSLAQLKQLPLDELKIDRVFTMDIGSEKSTEAIISSIISMAHNLGLSVIAEGVETKQQHDYLLDHQCDEYQGYLFSKAVTAEEFGTIIA